MLVEVVAKPMRGSHGGHVCAVQVEWGEYCQETRTRVGGPLCPGALLT